MIGTAGATTAKALLKPYPGEMIAYPVTKDVGSPKNDWPGLIEDVEG
jgi:putative SOS response-associated peptidase YedK